MKLLFENWRKYLKEEEEAPQVLAHLVGQAGSGKTYFINNTLLKKYPEIAAKDLDDFDDEADSAMGLKDKSWRASGDPKDIDQEIARKHFGKVQELLNSFLSENKDKNVFLAGMSVFPWVEGENELKLGDPKFKFYLDIEPETAAKRRISRDVEKGLYGDHEPTEEDFQSELKWAEEEKNMLLKSGYEAATPEQIMEKMDQTMGGGAINETII